MKVEAIAVGFIHGKLQQPGEQFEIEESQFSKVWMKRVDKPRRGRKPKQRKEGE